MKCIKCIKVAKGYELGEIRRIIDGEADDRVRGGYWKFVPKSEWKLATRKPKKAEAVVETASEELSIEEKKLKRNKKK
jgi:DNA-binding transcriptional MerR regulator